MEDKVSLGEAVEEALEMARIRNSRLRILAQDIRDLGYDLRNELSEESLEDLLDAGSGIDDLLDENNWYRNELPNLRKEIRRLRELEDCIPKVCGCCAGCEMEQDETHPCDYGFVLSIARAKEYLAKTVPVKHGKWEHMRGDEWCCTLCGYVISTEGSWEHPLDIGADFCEHCGSDNRRKNG